MSVIKSKQRTTVLQFRNIVFPIICYHKSHSYSCFFSKYKLSWWTYKTIHIRYLASDYISKTILVYFKYINGKKFYPLTYNRRNTLLTNPIVPHFGQDQTFLLLKMVKQQELMIAKICSVHCLKSSIGLKIFKPNILDHCEIIIQIPKWVLITHYYCIFSYNFNCHLIKNKILLLQCHSFILYNSEY